MMPFLSLDNETVTVFANGEEKSFPFSKSGLVRLGKHLGRGDYAFAGLDNVEHHRLISAGQAMSKLYRIVVPTGQPNRYKTIEEFSSNSLDEALSHAAFACRGMSRWVLVDGLGEVIGAHKS
jgi:hypothetical protein